MTSILILGTNQLRVGWKCVQCNQPPKHNSVVITEPGELDGELEVKVQCRRGHETVVVFNLAAKYREEFNRGRKLKSVIPVEEIQWLLGRDTDIYLRPPYYDHVRCFVDQDTHDKILTLQPYPPYPFNNGPLDEFVTKARQESEKFAAEHGLIVKVSDHSWYSPKGPMRTILIEYVKVA